jgi:hypothetical protein
MRMEWREVKMVNFLSSAFGMRCVYRALRGEMLNCLLSSLKGGIKTGESPVQGRCQMVPIIH